MTRYGTLAALAGVDPTDHSAAASGLPPIDSVNVWPMVIGENSTSPRHELLVDANCLIQGDMKILRGKVRRKEPGRNVHCLCQFCIRSC